MDETDIRPTAFHPEQHLVGKLRSGKVVLEDDDRVDSALDPGAVEVKALLAGLNKEDVLIISGSDYPTTFSHEIGVVVQRVGSATKRLAVGDYVVGFSFDKFATLEQVREDLLQRFGQSESITEMTSLPMGYGAALHGLKTLANLQPRDCIHPVRIKTGCRCRDQSHTSTGGLLLRRRQCRISGPRGYVAVSI